MRGRAQQGGNPRNPKSSYANRCCNGTRKRGPFKILERLAKIGLGGPVGSGNQYVSWLHIKDFCRAIEWIIEHPDLSGAINLAAPTPLANHELMAKLRRAVGRSIGLPAPTPLLKLGTFFLRTEPELVLKSRRAPPTRLINSGFKFQYPDWESAVKDLVATSPSS